MTILSHSRLLHHRLPHAGLLHHLLLLHHHLLLLHHHLLLLHLFGRHHTWLLHHARLHHAWLHHAGLLHLLLLGGTMLVSTACCWCKLTLEVDLSGVLAAVSDLEPFVNSAVGANGR